MMNLNVTRAASYAAAFTALAFAPFASRAQAATDDVAALREQIRQLDQKLRVLERNLELKEETAAAAAKAQPKLTAGDGRLEIVSADGANSIRLRGLVQADGRYYIDDTNATTDTFLLRRARLAFEGKFSNIFAYTIQTEFAGSAVSVLDANVLTAINPAFNVRIGRFKTPIGLEQLQSDPVAFFAERSVATNLTPNRDVGIQLEGAFATNTVSYQLGVFNGVPDAGNAAQNTQDFDNQKTVAARVFATPFVNDKESALKGLGFGIAASQGYYDGSSARTGGYRTDGQQTFFSYETTVIADGKAATISPQAYYYYGPLGVLAEYVSSTTDVRRSTALPVRVVDNVGWNVSAGYVLTGEDAGYKGVTPKTVFNPSAGTWGAFEVVARVAAVDIDDTVFSAQPATTGTAAAQATQLAARRLANPDSSASGVTTYGLGLNWYPAKAVRVGLNYFIADYDLAPGAKPAAGSVISKDEEVLIGRVQLSF
jgi:phosphate-selective porin OprO/OprP